MVNNDICITKSRSRDIKLQISNFGEENENIVFLDVTIKIENNRIRDVMVDRFMVKQETICHISVTRNTEVMKHVTQSVRHGKYNKRILMVVMTTKMKQKEFN